MAILSACSGSPAPSPSTSTSGFRRHRRRRRANPLPAVPTTANPATGPVGPLRSPGGPFLVDRDGRTVLLHGVDLVYKIPPYEVEVNGTGPQRPHPAEAQRMAATRLQRRAPRDHLEGARAGHRPDQRPRHLHARDAPGHRVPTSSTQPCSTPTWRASRPPSRCWPSYGISSLIDMHQDVYNEAFGGEGAPNWAVCTDGITPEAAAERRRTGASTTPAPGWPRPTGTSGTTTWWGTSRGSSTRSGPRSPPASGATPG